MFKFIDNIEIRVNFFQYIKLLKFNLKLRPQKVYIKIKKQKVSLIYKIKKDKIDGLGTLGLQSL